MATASVHTPQGAKDYVFVAELGEIWDRLEHFSELWQQENATLTGGKNCPVFCWRINEKCKTRMKYNFLSKVSGLILELVRDKDPIFFKS